MMDSMNKIKNAFYKIYIAVLKKTIHYCRKRFEEMRASIESEVATLARRTRGTKVSRHTDQHTGDLPVLYLSAVRAHLRLKEFSVRLVEGMPGTSVVKTSHGERVEIKDFFRAMEKMTLEGNPKKRDQVKFMFDIGREGISFNGYGELGDVVKKFANHPDICVVRIKDRLSSMEKILPGLVSFDSSAYGDDGS